MRKVFISIICTLVLLVSCGWGIDIPKNRRGKEGGRATFKCQEKPNAEQLIENLCKQSTPGGCEDIEIADSQPCRVAGDQCILGFLELDSACDNILLNTKKICEAFLAKDDASE